MRKKTGGEKMPVQMIGDILAAELSHMQAYIRFCSCQLNGATLLQQKTDEDADFKEFLKVRPAWDIWVSVLQIAQASSAWRQRHSSHCGMAAADRSVSQFPKEAQTW